MIGDLESLIAPLPKAEFIDHFVRKERLHVKAVEPDRASALLPWAEVDRLLSAGALAPESMRLARDGKSLDPVMYRQDGGEGPVRLETVHDLLCQGASLVLSHVEDLAPGVARLCDAIERDLSCKTKCNAYVSCVAGSALSRHCDLHDVLVVQVEGRKRWKSFGMPVPFPVAPPAKAGTYEALEAVWEGLLEPGDVLYIPRGEVHVAQVDGPRSIHLTIGLRNWRGTELLEAVAAQAAESVLFRRDVPVQGGAQAIADYQAMWKAAARVLIEQMDVAAFLDAGDRSRSLRSVAGLGHETPVQPGAIVLPAPRRRIPLAVGQDGPREVEIGGTTFCLSAHARRVLEHLVLHDGAIMHEMASALSPHLSDTQMQDAVAELFRNGLAGVLA